jgi:hypothetical protein
MASTRELHPAGDAVAFSHTAAERASQFAAPRRCATKRRTRGAESMRYVIANPK